MEFDDYWDDPDDDDTLSSDSLDYDGTDNWPLHADCKYDLTQTGKEAWVLSPRSLKHLCALKVVKSGLPSNISCIDIPKDLYQTLFIEACRLKCEVTIARLVSTWPEPVLDLQNVEIPLDCYRGYYTKAVGSDKSLASMIIGGLLEMKPASKLKKVIIPESEAEGALLMKQFLQLPATVLQDTPVDVKVQWVREQTNIEGVVRTLHLGEFPAYKKENFGRDISNPVVICLPGVVQWTGRSSNYLDVLLGLSLASHTPFIYHFDRIGVCNARNMDVIRDILKLVTRPELVRRLRFVTQANSMLHAYSYLDNLAPQLQTFTAVESVVAMTTGLHVVDNLLANFDFRKMCNNIKTLFACWKQLQELDLGGNILLGTIGNMLNILEQPLKRLNLSGTDLTKTDILALAESHHAASLLYLNLDHNDLHRLREPMKLLLQRLVSISSLRTCNCRLNYQDSVALAKALSHSHTLKTWNLLQNRLTNLSELKHFVQHCSQIPSLKEVGCKPIDLHAFFAGLYIHTDGPAVLTDDERREIIDLANRLNLMVF